MTDREKLSDLLYEASRKADSERYIFDQIADHLIANGVTVGDKLTPTADKLSANGVVISNLETTTMQQWIPVAERLPQEDEPAGATCEQVQVLLSDGFVTTGWCNRGMKMWFYLPYGDTHFVGNDYEKSPVIAWQPLAKSPKE